MLPSFPQEQSFALSLALFQVICLAFFAAHFKTNTPKTVSPTAATTAAHSLDATSSGAVASREFYSMFMDVHVMIFVGFGFLMTYLRKYSLSAVSLTFVVGVLALQWGIVTVTLAHQIQAGAFPRAAIDVPMLINGDFAAATVLVSFGAVLGKVTPTQLLWMTFFELIFYATNECVLLEGLEVIDAGGSLVIHTFGAFFGLAVSRHLGVPLDQSLNSARYTSDVFAMVGTLFLWMFWPSFNAAVVPTDGFRQDRAVVHTLLSITGSCTAAFAASAVLTHTKKFDMAHLQNATLAGGVTMGAACELALNPGSALTVGILAGLLSVCGYRFLTPALERRFRLSDTAGVLNLHGMPGVLGGLACGFATMALPDDRYGDSAPISIYKAREHRSAAQQGGYQLLAIVVTAGIALASGSLVGVGLRSRAFRQQKLKFDDQEWFHLSATNDSDELLALRDSPQSVCDVQSMVTGAATESPHASYELMSAKV